MGFFSFYSSPWTARHIKRLKYLYILLAERILETTTKYAFNTISSKCRLSEWDWTFHLKRSANTVKASTSPTGHAILDRQIMDVDIPENVISIKPVTRLSSCYYFLVNKEIKTAQKDNIITGKVELFSNALVSRIFSDIFVIAGVIFTHAYLMTLFTFPLIHGSIDISANRDGGISKTVDTTTSSVLQPFVVWVPVCDKC